MKRIILNVVLGIIIILTLSVSGCGINNETKKLSELDNSSESIRDNMIEFMNKKYDKTFIGLSLERVGYGRSSDKLVCYPEDGDRDKDYTYVYRDKKDGVVEYSDTYFSALIQDEAKSEIESILGNLGFKVKTSVGTLTYIYPNEYDSSKTYNDIKLDKTVPTIIGEAAITSDKGSFSEEESQKLFNALEDAGISGVFTLFYFDNELFESINDSNLEDTLIPTNDDVIVYYFKSLE